MTLIKHRFMTLTLAIAYITGCMPYKPVASRVTTGPVPTFTRPNAILCDPKQVLERAITVRGGESQLKKLETVWYSGYGKSAPQNQVTLFRFRTLSALPDRTRDESDYDGGVKFVQVFNREKGWYSINNDVKEMDAVNSRVMRELLYVNRLLTLLPMRDSTFTLEPLPEQRKEGVVVQGFIVKSKEQRDVSMFFEKENGLLLSVKTRTVDPNTYIEKEQETFFSQYVPMQGILFPKRWVVYSDGNKSMELTFEELKLLDKVDDILFAKP